MRILLIFGLIASLVFGASLPTGAPEQAGFSRDRLNRISTVMQEHVAAGRLAGASGLIARHGKVVFRETWGEMKPDTIVRMFSMTKAVTGVAAMMLYEEGKFSLNDPVSKYLPEFARMTVAREGVDAAGKRTWYTVPADRQITVRDLFRHTSGLDYAGPKDESGEPAYKKIEMTGFAPLVPFDLAEGMRRLASVPLNDQPGTTFRYGYSIDVLGRLVEVVSGKKLDRFFEERIFGPLGMKDTAFYVPEEKWSRLAALYAPKPGGGIERSSSPFQESFKKKPALLLGGAGMVGTLEDYARFVMMLLNDGQLEGVRLLGRKTVELMRSDHLGNLPRIGGVPEGYGFGLTFAVNLGPGKSTSVGSAGEYNWGGAAGTSFWIDPQEHLMGVFLIQVLPPTSAPAGDQFKRLAYQALE
ncbi:MAG TPA: serine hydrolase domain-containing protein [Candidatus Acidoferrales bacterium]|jgi:CubicO group peptidase (beta-lactamase class C family)|nr:serine hydrolase domain-containing protein [Candidatus Acidoferrales bacterium]